MVRWTGQIDGWIDYGTVNWYGTVIHEEMFSFFKKKVRCFMDDTLLLYHTVLLGTVPYRTSAIRKESE